MAGGAGLRRRRLSRRGMSFLLAAVSLVFAAPAFAAQTITGVAANATSGLFAISLVTAGADPLQVKSFELDSPKRLVFDLPDACLAKGLPTSLPVTFPGIRQLRLGQFGAEPAVARIVLDLTADEAPRWHVRRGEKPGETLIVFGPPGPVVLPTPVVKREGGCLLLRLAGGGELKRSVDVLEGPYRVYADLENASASWYRAEYKGPPLRAIRMGPQQPRDGRPVARIVLELSEKQAHTVFSDGPDLVIAVGPQPWSLPLPEYAAAGRLKGKTIVVDPGHGGSDIGAPAAPGSPPSEPYEKNVTPMVAQRLVGLLKAEGASVTMTREDDTFVPLQKRAAIANDLKADALVSIHCNSSNVPNCGTGTMVFYDHPHSERLAQLVQSEMVGAVGTADRGVEGRNFDVIRKTKGPGILVETAFINHDRDRAMLVNANAQERMARAIVQGLVEYLRVGAHGSAPS